MTKVKATYLVYALLFAVSDIKNSPIEVFDTSTRHQHMSLFAVKIPKKIPDMPRRVTSRVHLFGLPTWDSPSAPSPTVPHWLIIEYIIFTQLIMYEDVTL